MTTTRTVGDRSYDLLRPARWNGLVLVHFAGGATTLDAMREIDGLDDLAEQHGFALVRPRTARVVTLVGRRLLYGPEMLSWSWPGAEGCCGRAWEDQIDDLAFARAIDADLPAALGAEPTAVYLAGISNGGMLALACAQAGAFRQTRGVAVVATACVSPEAGLPRVPLLWFHGTSDTAIPYGGGVVESGHGFRADPVEATVGALAVANGAAPGPYTSRAIGRINMDWMAPAGGARTRLVRMIGRGHWWPRDAIVDCSTELVAWCGLSGAGASVAA